MGQKPEHHGPQNSWGRRTPVNSSHTQLFIQQSFVPRPALGTLRSSKSLPWGSP